MWTVYIGTLIPGVKDHLTEFYDRPFEVFGSYYDTGLYRMPWEYRRRSLNHASRWTGGAGCMCATGKR